MRVWYKSWYGADVPDSAIGSMGTMDRTDLKSLEDTELFDKELIEQMILRHKMAIMMASNLLSRTEHIEMKKLA